MPFTSAILGSVLAYIWLIEPHVPRSAVLAPAAVLIVLAAWHDFRHREWGFCWTALVPGMWRALVVTFVAVLLILGAGVAAGTLHDRRDFLGSLAPLVLWGGAQQYSKRSCSARPNAPSRGRPV